MKTPKSKKSQRQELEQLMEQYLASGGKVESVPSGTSGNTLNSNLFRRSGAPEPKSERTPVTDVVKTLEERKHAKSDQSKHSDKKKRPRKKLIVDDFGDPVRWVWEDE